MTQQERFITYQTTIQGIKKELERRYYFLEEEELTQRPDEKAWSIVEHIAHINLVNYAYIKQLEGIDFEKLAPSNEGKTSWFGRFFTQLMAPKKNGKPLFKMPAPKMFLPVSVTNSNAKILPRVAFEDFMKDLSFLEKIADKAGTKNVSKIKVATALGTWPKLNLIDVFEVIIAHTNRHLAAMGKAKNPKK